MAKKKTNSAAIVEKPKMPQYFASKGGRKTAIALVRVFEKKGGLIVNDKDYKEYFKDEKSQVIAHEPLKIANVADKVSATVRVKGGGLNAQAEAVRNGLARALAKSDTGLRGALKRAGFLTRDARMVERKKYGLKKARRAPQWSKR